MRCPSIGLVRTIDERIPVQLGIEYFPQSDLLLVALSSGVFYTFTLTPIPTLVIDPQSALPTSTQVTDNARLCFAKVARSVDSTQEAARNKMHLDKYEGMQIQGMAKWGNNGDVGWLYEWVPCSLVLAPEIDRRDVRQQD